MCREELFESVLQEVCKAFEMEREQVLNGRKEESVDARSVLIEVLSRYLNDSQVGDLIGKDRRSVNYLRNNFRDRIKKWAVRVAYDEVKRYLCGG